jgi:hypothetical protein
MTVPYRVISRAATVTAAAASALAYSRLKPRVATHFNNEDMPDRYSSRAAAALGLPGLMVGLSVGTACWETGPVVLTAKTAPRAPGRAIRRSP